MDESHKYNVEKKKQGKNAYSKDLIHIKFKNR